MHTERDVIALDKDGFFKMDRQWHYDVAEELLKVLMESGIKYHLDKIHPVVRKELLRCLEEEKATKEAEKAAKEAEERAAKEPTTVNQNR